MKGSKENMRYIIYSTYTMFVLLLSYSSWWKIMKKKFEFTYMERSENKEEGKGVKFTSLQLSDSE